MKRFFTLFTALFLMGSMMVVQADYYVAGTMNIWNAEDSNYKMSGSNPHYVTKQLNAGDYQFKITQGSWSWSTNSYDQNASNVTLSEINGNIAFSLITTSDVTFYYNASTGKAYVQAVAVVVPSYTFPNGTTIYYDFTAYGQGINDKDGGWHSDVSSVFGITLSSDWTVTAGIKLWRSEAGGWSDKTCTTLPTEGQNMIVSTDGLTYTWGTYVPSSDPGEDPGQDPVNIYTIVGSSAELFGEAWNQAKAENDMVLQSDGITYVKSYTNVALSKEDIDYKVAKDHKWGDGEYPTGMNNQKLEISQAGTYNVTFSYIPSTPELTAEATLIEPSVDPEPTVTTITIKGKVPAEWTNAINVYVFGTSDANGFHPATQEGEWWSYTYTGASTSINAIFVNGDDWNGLPAYYQTVDITDISADACYELTYKSGDKAIYEAVDCPSTPEPPVVLGVRLNGDFETPGNPMDTEIFTGDDESVSLKMNLVEGNYVFGLVINDVMFVNGTAFTRENPSAEITDGNNELTFDADVDGEYTFTWTYATNTLSITYPAAQPVEYATIKFFAPRDQTNKWDHVYAYATKGNKKDFGPKPGTEITDKDAEWYVVTVRKGSNLLFTDNYGMETTVIENIQEDACYVSTAINYNVTPKIVSLTQQCNVDYYVAGDAAIMGSWNEAYAPCKLDENNQVIFHDVPAGSYQFKITNGTWAWSIGGNDFLSDEPGCGTIASEVDLGNTGFTIDEVQDVTITYDPATRKICLGALTVKTVGTLTASDINLYVDETKYPSYVTNIEGYTAADVELTFVSGDACVEFVEGQIKGTAEGTAVVRVTIAETALYTSATDEFTVTVSAVPVPPTPSEDWVEVRSGLEAGRHYTVCLENNVTAVKGATFWSLTYRNEGGTAAYLVEETAPFDAGKPYIFQATGDNEGKLEVVYGTETEINPVVNGALRGTFSYMAANVLAAVEGTVYMLYNNALCPMGTDNHLDAHRAYVRYDLLQEAPVQGFAPGKRVKSMPMQGQTTTGIDALNASEAPVKMIIDGNLYILRGEKMYDATGRLVK